MIPQGTMRLKTGPGWLHAEAVVPIIAELARQDASHPWIVRWTRQAIRRVPRGDAEAEARSIGRAALRDVRYVRDPRGHEFITAPHRTLMHGAADCDEIAGLIAAAALSINRTPRFVVMARRDAPGEPVHIWTQIRGPRGWIDVDPVPRPPRFGIGEGVDGIWRTWDIHGQEIPMYDIDPYPDLAYIDGFWARLWSGVKKVAKVAGGIIAKIAPAAGALVPGLGPAASAAGAITELVSGGGGPSRRAAPAAPGAPPAPALGPTVVGPGGVAHRLPAPAAGGPPAPVPRAVMVRPAPTRRAAPAAPGAVMVRPAPARATAPLAVARAAVGLPAAARPAPQAVQLFAAALEQQRAAAAMRAAQQAAAAFRAAGGGLGLMPVTEAAVASGDLRTLAAQAVYAVRRGLAPGAQRARIERFQRAAGIPVTGVWDAATRSAAAAALGRPESMMPPPVGAGRRRAAEPPAASEAPEAPAATATPVQVAPPGTVPPAAPSAPAGIPPSVAAAGAAPAAPAAAAAPSGAGPVQVAPPGTVTTAGAAARGMDTATVALLIILGVAIARRRR